MVVFAVPETETGVSEAVTAVPEPVEGPQIEVRITELLHNPCPVIARSETTQQSTNKKACMPMDCRAALAMTKVLDNKTVT